MHTTELGSVPCNRNAFYTKVRFLYSFYYRNRKDDAVKQESFRYDPRKPGDFKWQKSKYDQRIQRQLEKEEKMRRQWAADNQKKMIESTTKGVKKKMSIKEESAQGYYDRVLQDGLNKMDQADEIRANYTATCEKLRADKEALILGTIGYEQALAEATQEAEQKMEALKSTLDPHMDAYAERMKEYAALDGSRLTDDVKLLDGSLQLSAEDVDTLLDRYPDNYLMQKKIWDYWTQQRRPQIEEKNSHIVPGMYGIEAEPTRLRHVLQSPQEKQQNFNTFIRHMKNCLGDVSRAGAHPDNFGDMRDYMKTITGDYLKRNVPEGNGEYDLKRYEVQRVKPTVRIW
jgi:hypothetical protein